MGLGVKTTRLFLKGEVVAEYPGDLVRKWSEYKRRDNKYNASGKNESFLYEFFVKGKRYWFVLISYILY
jgi:hypothetical protein